MRTVTCVRIYPTFLIPTVCTRLPYFVTTLKNLADAVPGSSYIRSLQILIRKHEIIFAQPS
jgi:hypothetical protein